MDIYSKMQQLFSAAASRLQVEEISIGLGYTAVTLSDGSLGIAYTYLEEKKHCTLVSDPTDYEGRPAAELLEKLWADNLVERSEGVAVVNALNHRRARGFPEDRGTLLDDLGVSAGTTVAMAGYFAPVVREIEARGARVEAHDIGKGIGEREEFYRLLESGRAGALILTSTSIVGGTTEEVLAHLSPQTPCVLLGPTTPMIPEAFDHLPVQFFGGTLPVRNEGVRKAVRQGMGTPAIHKAAKKIYYRRGADELPPLEPEDSARSAG